MRLDGMTIAFLIGDGFEDLEFWAVYMRLLEEGAKVQVVGSDATTHYTSKRGGKMGRRADVAASEVDANTCDAVVIPGGWAPDRMRRDPDMLALVRACHEAGKPVAMICHAGLVGISAGIVAGHRATGSLGIKDDLVNAGAEWVDQPAFTSGNLVWGRVVEDIPAFNRLLVEVLGKWRVARQV